MFYISGMIVSNKDLMCVNENGDKFIWVCFSNEVTFFYLTFNGPSPDISIFT